MPGLDWFLATLGEPFRMPRRRMNERTLAPPEHAVVFRHQQAACRSSSSELRFLFVAKVAAPPHF